MYFAPFHKNPCNTACVRDVFERIGVEHEEVRLLAER
jgi:hypothetical protein